MHVSKFVLELDFNDSAKKRGPPKGYIEALENRLHRMENLLGGLVHTGERSKADLDSLNDDEDAESLDANWVPHSPDTPTAHSASESPSTTSMTAHDISVSDEEDVLPFDKDARKKINELSDSLDSMSLDDGGFVRYLGNSSGIDLIQKNQQLKNGYLMVPVKVRDHQQWLVEKENEVLQLASTMTCPPTDLAEHLIDIYFKFVHPHLPVLHKNSFLRQYRNPDPEKKPPLVLLNAMFALASRFTTNPEIIGHGDDPEGFGDEYFARAKKLVDLEYELPRQSSIQALLLMVTYRFTSAKSGGRVWVMLGMAIRMAQDLGMHRNSARWHLPPLETEVRKRLWWSCYVMDRWVSASMGRPVEIDDNDCDVDFPALIEQDWKDSDEFATSRETQEQTKMENIFAMKFFIESIKLSQIMGKILKRIYSANTRNHGPAQVSTKVAELDTLLTKWHLALPSDLKYDHQAVAAGRVKMNRWVAGLHMSYYSALILLHRPYMIPTSLTKTKLSESLPSLNICVSAANSITHLSEKLDEAENVDTAWNFSTYDLFSSSLIHLTNSASMDLRLQAQARKNIAKNIKYMKKLGVRWFNAAKFSNMLEDLLLARINFEEYNPEGRTLEPVMVAKVNENGSPYPIVLRDQHHPSGGTLLFAPRGTCCGVSSTVHTPSSDTSTPSSSPATVPIHNPDVNPNDPKSTSTSSTSTSDAAMGSQRNSQEPEPNATQASTGRAMKKTRKPTTSQQAASIFIQTAVGSSPSPTTGPPMVDFTMEPESLFPFSSLTTPGMFAEGQTFMDFDQMVAHQLQPDRQQPPPMQAFTATPLFSSPLALQGAMQPSTSQPQGQQGMYQQQQFQQYLQQQHHQQQLNIQNQPSPQNYPVGQDPSGYQQNSYVFSGTNGINSNGPAKTLQQSFVNRLGMDATVSATPTTSSSSIPSTVESAIPSRPTEYSNLALFPSQDNVSASLPNPNVAVPNPFFGIPNTIDWDEWNKYIASAGLQKI
ncbi:Transcriptional activator of fatty acid utilization [Podila epicladia]|nr:Transcriptional activator of fatty acid utilization [Podila epicladia]